MPAPTEPRPETRTRLPSLARGDETIAVAPSAPAAGGFGPPAALGEVGTLGPYRLVRQLGKGGMGAVYAAIDARLGRRVALKVMLPQFAADSDARSRFLREARLVARIKHDNVVVVYEADECGGVPYLAMEFLDGYPLDRYLKAKGDPTIPQTLRIGMEVAAGLAAAHRISLVHRDIKPANLWLEVPNGRVRVLDFGLARPIDPGTELTGSGVIVGTPAYMSPEQARAERVDHRTDLWSLGAVLYRLVTGRNPFGGPTAMAVLMAVGVDEPTPIGTLNPGVPGSLAALIHQLLSKRADARPRSAEEVRKRLRAIAEELAAPRSAELSTSQPRVVQPRVVSAPIPVAALPPEQNPFVDIDSAGAGTPSEAVDSPTAATPNRAAARRKPGGRWLWPGAGLAALLALSAGGFIILKNKDSTATKVKVPEGVSSAAKEGVSPDRAGIGTKEAPAADRPADSSTAAPADPDRAAAEWAIELGATVRINGQAKDYKVGVDLPPERFALTHVALSARPGVTNEGLECLKDLRDLARLDLDSTRVSDAGLSHLGRCKGLTKLYIGRTQVSDAGLEHLKGLEKLTVINVQKTRVTAKGLQEFSAAVPACQIIHDGGIIEPKK